MAVKDRSKKEVVTWIFLENSFRKHRVTNCDTTSLNCLNTTNSCHCNIFIFHLPPTLSSFTFTLTKLLISQTKFPPPLSSLATSCFHFQFDFHYLSCLILQQAAPLLPHSAPLPLPANLFHQTHARWESIHDDCHRQVNTMNHSGYIIFWYQFFFLKKSIDS